MTAPATVFHMGVPGMQEGMHEMEPDKTTHDDKLQDIKPPASDVGFELLVEHRA